MNGLRAVAAVVGIFCAGYFVAAVHPFGATTATAAAPASRVFEMRTYTAHEGRLDALHQRFTNHTMRLFERHGMTNVGYWVPHDSTRTLVYILAHSSREAARESWRAFREDTEWQAARAASEEDGPIVQRVESIFMDAVPYSPLK
jgi:hypothetical protein